MASLRAKLITYHVALLLALLSVLGLLLYSRLSRIVYSAVDSRLLARAGALAAGSVDSGDARQVDVPDAFRWEYRTTQSGSFFELRDSAGRPMAKSASLGGLDLPWHPEAAPAYYQTVSFQGEPVRVVAYRTRPDEGESPRDALVIQCATRLRSERELLRRFAGTLAATTLVILVASALGGGAIAQAVLKPIRAISASIGRVSEASLNERIEVAPIPPELKGIAASFNRTMARLEGAFRRQKEFTADASHELRTPLSVIISQGEVALRKARDPEEYAATLGSILQTARLMSGMIEKLLALARLGTDAGALQRECLDLGEVAQGAVELVAPLARRRDVSIAVASHAGFAVWGDRAALVEVFMNLLDNAIKYNRPSGAVSVRVERDGDHVLATVSDAGPGIPEKDLGNVLERFYRVDKSRSRELGGAGLGLSICSEIVKLHGGTLCIESQVGAGTTVLVRLPAAQQHAAPS